MYRQSLDNLLKALRRIEEPYYHTPEVRMIDNQLDINVENFITYENNFTSQLLAEYKVLAHLGELKESRPFLRELQILKRFAWSEDPDLGIRAAIERLRAIPEGKEDVVDELKTIPDFIIHKSQGNRERINQQLIAEIKTEAVLSYSRFAWDFFKLNVYLNKFNFQTACFIAINTDLKTVESYIGRYLDENHYYTTRTRDLFVVVKENFQSEIITKSLHKIKFLM
ncbi:hypothetical protein LT679_02065 [Mucilaginibacter roseus]|uniref:Uncharacterized protein n=1 Tax=Mucilaginibacter roseus TaxID=1528868 RepID=A0ABS8TWX1_9SPHI|nr:hypothetical protein [Mucilaginibacter roseus]MCD8739375.1 hypothetical protein [Mucilaginibacter roseus]